MQGVRTAQSTSPSINHYREKEYSNEKNTKNNDAKRPFLDGGSGGMKTRDSIN